MSVGIDHTIKLRGGMKQEENKEFAENYILKFREPAVVIEKTEDEKFPYKIDLYIGTGDTPIKDMTPVGSTSYPGIFNKTIADYSATFKKFVIGGIIIEVLQTILIIFSFIF